jgi:hypothetical protein
VLFGLGVFHVEADEFAQAEAALVEQLKHGAVTSRGGIRLGHQSRGLE